MTIKYGDEIMNWYVLLHTYDLNGNNQFRSIRVTSEDLEKSTQWNFDHQRGRDFVKNSFGDMHYEWNVNDAKGLPISDFPFSGNPSGNFSQKAVKALSPLLVDYGDLHPLIMTTGERYFAYDCWSFVDALSYEQARFSEGAYIKSINIKEDELLPEIFRVNKQPRLVVNEKFKQTAEDAGLTGMVFSPLQINVIKSD